MKQAAWFLSMFCPNGCTHCSSGKDTADRRALSPAQAGRILRRLSGYGVTDVKLAGGEPFLYKDLISSIIAPGNKKGILFDITSSGVGLRERDLDALLSSGYNNQLTLSLDGDAPAVNDKVRFKGSFERVKSCLEHIRARIGDKGTDLSVVVRHTVTAESSGRISRMLKFMDRYPVDAVLVTPVEPVGSARESALVRPGAALDALGKKISAEARRHKYLIKYNAAGPSRELKASPVRNTCYSHDDIFIDNLGNLLPCSRMLPGGALEKETVDRLFRKGFAAPSLLASGVKTALGSGMFRHFDKLFEDSAAEQRKLKKCSVCAYREKCRICPIKIMAAKKLEKTGGGVFPCREL